MKGGETNFKDFQLLCMHVCVHELSHKTKFFSDPSFALPFYSIFRNTFIRTVISGSLMLPSYIAIHFFVPEC